MARHTIVLPEPVADIYRAVEKLEKAYPERKFTPDGHLMGSIGEVIAKEHFGLTLCRMSQNGVDAYDLDGNAVEVKITAGKHISMYCSCTRLIVLRVLSPEKAEVVYDGPGKPVWDAVAFDKDGQLRKLPKNAQRRISLIRLDAIANGKA